MALAKAQTLCRHPAAATLREFIANASAFEQLGIASFSYGVQMHKHVRAAIVRLYEAVPLRWIEPLHRAKRHIDPFMCVDQYTKHKSAPKPLHLRAHDIGDKAGNEIAKKLRPPRGPRESGQWF
jgi:hypothetical protein